MIVGARQLPGIHQHRLHCEVRIEAQFIEAMAVGGVGDGDKQAVAAFEQRQCLMLVNQLFT